MKERPILMTPENAQKCFDGTKVQTRRVVQKRHIPLMENLLGALIDGKWNQRPLPFGKPGDRLWVREPHAWPGEEGYLYRGNHEHSALVEKWRTDPNCPQIKWTPSIHMERSACRTVLEITGVRVERLHEISEADAKAEGCSIPSVMYPDSPLEAYSYAEQYRLLWESINGAGSWVLNPWVWVIEFRKVANV